LNKKIIFVTGTRADWGKLKPLVIETSNQNFEVYLFITGMHNNRKYGDTYLDVQRVQIVNFHRFDNSTNESSMDLTVSKTINGFSKYVKDINPDLILVHGDRPEPLACAIVGSFQNILVAHIEGGEVSGTIDELIRHSISKLSHIHFVSNKKAKQRLVQMGESNDSIYIIGSPDIDLMFSKNLPTLNEAREKYDINFDNYAICLFHPVTTEIDKISSQINCLTDSLIQSNLNYIIVYPNNDLGSTLIINTYNKLNSKNFLILPSIRFEYFLTILKNADFIIGNSSAGVREAPYYSLTSINLGTRQNQRDNNKFIINTTFSKKSILNSIKKVSQNKDMSPIKNFGDGNSSKLFLKILNDEKLWLTNNQKNFNDLATNENYEK